jgi:type II secretory pathway component HofQ
MPRASSAAGSQTRGFIWNDFMSDSPTSEPSETPTTPAAKPASPAVSRTESGSLKRYNANVALILRRLADEDRMNQVRRGRGRKNKKNGMS